MEFIIQLGNKSKSLLLFALILVSVSACSLFDSKIYFETQEETLNSIDDDPSEKYEIIEEKSLGGSTFIILYYDEMDAIRNVIISKGKDDQYYVDKVDARFVLSSQKDYDTNLGFIKSEKISNIIKGDFEFEGENFQYYIGVEIIQKKI